MNATVVVPVFIRNSLRGVWKEVSPGSCGIARPTCAAASGTLVIQVFCARPISLMFSAPSSANIKPVVARQLNERPRETLQFETPASTV